MRLPGFMGDVSLEVGASHHKGVVCFLHMHKTLKDRSSNVRKGVIVKKSARSWKHGVAA